VRLISENIVLTGQINQSSLVGGEEDLGRGGPARQYWDLGKALGDNRVERKAWEGSGPRLGGFGLFLHTK
jgi:hypothetical protein